MKTIYKTALSLVACMLCSGLTAQTIERDVFAAAGANQSATGVELSSTIGESVTSTFVSGTVRLNQGFQQSGLLSTSLAENESIAVDYSLYPNPTANQLNLRLEASKSTKATLRIVGINGQEVRTEMISLNASQPYKRVFDLSNLPAGNYILSIQGENGKANVVEQIQKIK